MAKTTIEKVYCWTGGHLINPARWLSHAGMCQACYDALVAEVAAAYAEPVTEPRIPATVGHPNKPCSANGCHDRAVDACWICRDALCPKHVQTRRVNGDDYTVCADCKGAI